MLNTFAFLRNVREQNSLKQHIDFLFPMHYGTKLKHTNSSARILELFWGSPTLQTLNYTIKNHWIFKNLF